MHRTTPAIAALLCMPALALPAVPAHARACNERPTYEARIVCHVNAERSRHGLRALSVDGRLARAADRHSGDMVARGYFSHRSPGGASASDRVRRAGYAPRMVGEALAYATRTLAAPGRIVGSWLRSPGHRAVLLHRSPDDIGVGAVSRTPSRRAGVTVTLVVGRGG